VSVEPEWIGPDVALAIHEEQVAEHGGAEGVRDRGLLESALARPRSAWGYGVADLCALGAAIDQGLSAAFLSSAATSAPPSSAWRRSSG